MSKEEAIKYLQQLYPNGGHCWLDEQRIEAISMAVKAMQEEPVSEDLGEYINELSKQFPEVSFAKVCKIATRTAKWQKEHLWKPAYGDDLPEIDREVIALLDNGKVVFAHRPPEYWDGKDIVTDKVTRNYPKTYGKGGWNIPDVKWWMDCLLPNMEED